jgi:hypothetical protein
MDFQGGWIRIFAVSYGFRMPPGLGRRQSLTNSLTNVITEIIVTPALVMRLGHAKQNCLFGALAYASTDILTTYTL